MSRFADLFGVRVPDRARAYEPSPYCVLCGWKKADDYGFCWIHRTEYVVMAYRPGRIGSLPIKSEIYRRMKRHDYSQSEMAEVLGVPVRRLQRLLDPYCVWLTHSTADFWITKLQIDAPAGFWEAA